MATFTSAEWPPSFMEAGNMGDINWAGEGSNDLDILHGEGTLNFLKLIN